MQLLTKEILSRFEKIGSQENVAEGDKIVVCKFFNPAGGGTWYATEYDPQERMFFGFVTFSDMNDPDAEWGYFSLDELSNFRGMWGLGIERDYYFNNIKFSEIK